MKTHQFESGSPLWGLHALARYETHGGYSWAAVMSDGEFICPRCILENFRQVFRATKARDSGGWAVAGLANSGESDAGEIATCCNCNRTLWEG